MSDVSQTQRQLEPGMLDDSESFEDFWKSTHLRIQRGLLKAAFGSIDDVADATQHAFAHLWHMWNCPVDNAGRSDSNGLRLRRDLDDEQNIAFVRTIARNRLVDLHRKRLRLDPIPDGFDIVDPIDEVEKLHERWMEADVLRDLTPFYRKLYRLPERQREVAESFFLRGLQPHEIAELLNLSSSTVRTHLQRAHKHLRPLFDELRKKYAGEVGDE